MLQTVVVPMCQMNKKEGTAVKLWPKLNKADKLKYVVVVVVVVVVVPLMTIVTSPRIP